MRIIRSIALGSDTRALAIFRNYKIDVAFESADYFGWRFPIPAIAWIPDLQHRSHPDFFSWSRRSRREAGFTMQMMSGRTMLMSSHSALREFRRHYAWFGGNTAVARFAVAPSLPSESMTWSLIGKYRLPKRYFFVPNQFWKHKNHGVLIEALALLRHLGKELHVVCSGSSLDSRHADYYSTLMKAVRDRGLERMFIHLGMISHSDVVALMMRSVGVINPSFMEGWNTGVEEAKAVGAPLLLSRIPAHLEQAPRAQFFNPGRPLSLAKLMARQVEKSSAADLIVAQAHLDRYRRNNQPAFVASICKAAQLALRNGRVRR